MVGYLCFEVWIILYYWRIPQEIMAINLSRNFMFHNYSYHTTSILQLCCRKSCACQSWFQSTAQFFYFFKSRLLQAGQKVHLLFKGIQTKSGLNQQRYRNLKFKPKRSALLRESLPNATAIPLGPSFSQLQPVSSLLSSRDAHCKPWFPSFPCNWTTGQS